MIKNIYKMVGTMLTILVLLISCEKDLQGVYNDDGRLYFFERANDNTQSRVREKSYSFLLDPSDVTERIVYIKIKAMGDTSSMDRYGIGQRIEEGSTAREGLDYEFLPALIPAGEVEGLLPVKLFRNERIKSEQLSLHFTIGETDDFKLGVVEDDDFTLRWTDQLSRPDTWIDGLFGVYSDDKYRFMIDILGIAEFHTPDCPRCEPRPGQYSYPALTDFVARLREELRAYNEAHPNNPKNFVF